MSGEMVLGEYGPARWTAQQRFGRLRLRNPGHQLDFNAGRGIGKLHAKRRARRGIFRKILSVDLVHGALFGFDIRHEHGHFQNFLERRPHRFEVRLVGFQDRRCLLLDIATKSEGIFARFRPYAGKP